VLTSARQLTVIESQMPTYSRVASSLTSINSAFNHLDNENLKLIVDTAHAIDSIANANLSNISYAKSKIAEQLFAQLNVLQVRLESIIANTKPQKAKIRQNIADTLQRMQFGEISAEGLDSGDTLQAIMWQLSTINMSLMSLKTSSFNSSLQQQKPGFGYSAGLQFNTSI
jgi:hypothetical protein